MGDPGHRRPAVSRIVHHAWPNGRRKKWPCGLEFSDPLAHRIEAGADIFLMPSRYEPCGLNQLYSLKYGTVPVVRATGGLADTVTDTTDETLAAGTATGFSFREYSGLALSETLDRACKAFANQAVWNRLIATGMRQDWSWASSARQIRRPLRADRRGSAASGDGRETAVRSKAGTIRRAADLAFRSRGLLTVEPGRRPRLRASAMPELRQDPIVGRWVIFSPARSARPHDFEPAVARHTGTVCPFCEGHENLSPAEVYAPARRRQPGEPAGLASARGAEQVSRARGRQRRARSAGRPNPGTRPCRGGGFTR